MNTKKEYTPLNFNGSDVYLLPRAAIQKNTMPLNDHHHQHYLVLWSNVVKRSRFYPTRNAQVSWSNNHSLKLCPFNCSNTPVSNCSPSFIDSSHWLTHCGLVTLYSNRYLGQHWFRWLLVAWWYLNPRWLIASKVQWHPSEGNFTRDKQRVLMHRHQGWNVRHGLCHIYMRYLYIYMSCL